METIITILALVIAIIFAVKAIRANNERDDTLCVNEELIMQLNRADINVQELEEEVSRWNGNYQSMWRKKNKFQEFLINFKEGDGEKIDKLLKQILSENKYLKAKNLKNDTNKQG